MIVEDNVVGFPALLTAGVPFVRIVSCNPLEIKDPGAAAGLLRVPGRRPGRMGGVPGRVRPGAPGGCGPSSTTGSPAQGAPPLPDLEFIHEGDVNLYVYPELADYRRDRPLGPRWHRLDSSVRETDEPFHAARRARPATGR